MGCETEAEIDELYQKLSAGGDVLMPMANYGFSEKFGWVNDKYGVSWQLTLASREQKISPFLMFVGQQHGQAEATMNFYVSLFKNSNISHIVRYGPGEVEPEGTVKHALFSLNGQEFMAMDSQLEHAFTFTPAISFLVNCETQAEIDELWEKLSAVKEAEQCGWLQDKYGVSWQIVPRLLNDLLGDKDPKKAQNVMKAILPMKKIDMDGLKQAYEQG